MAGKGKPSKKKSSPNGEGPLARLKALYRFMSDHNLESLELDEGGAHVRLVRKSANPAPVPVPVLSSAAPAAASAPASGAPAAPSVPAGSTAVKSPMMGIFYRAPSPSSPPFVKEGSVVKVGQVLCMIEAMKVFNEIKAEFAGTVLQMLVENGKPVKSGQDIYYIQRT